MKNNKGFTLIEITMVVLILSALTLIVVPAVRTVLSNSKDRAYQVEVDTIKDAAKSYHYNNSSSIETAITTSGYATVTLDQLKQDGYIIGDIENPKDKTNMQGYVKITKIATNQYNYDYIAQ